MASFSIASANPVIWIGGEKILEVTTSEWKSELINIQIKEESGAIVLEENIYNHKESRKYNLKNLPDGEYTVEVANKYKISTLSFSISGNDLVISTDSITAYKPIFIINHESIDLNLMTLGNKVVITIVNERNEVVFSEKLTTPSVNKRYDLRNLSKGQYSIVVFSNGRSYQQTLVK